MKPDHAFRQERSQPLTADRIARVPRNINSIARSTYRGPGPTLDQDALSTSLRNAGRIANFLQYVIPYTTAPVLVLPANFRSYLLLQNLSAVNTLFVGLNFQPANNQGLRIGPNEAYEPYVVPQDDVWVIGSAAGTLTLVYATI